MKAGQQQRLLAVVQPVLGQGEQVELLTFASVGVKRRVATAAVTTALTGGLLTMNVRPRRFYVALTSERVLFFNGDTVTGRPESKVAMQAPRPALSVASSKKGLLTATVQVAIAGQEKGLKFVFPLPMRSDVPAFVAALGEAPAA